MKHTLRVVLLLLALPFTAHAAVQIAPDTNLSLFADGQLLWGEGGQNSGFTMNDGAAYFSRNHQNSEFFVGLPFFGTNVPNPSNIPNVNSGGSSNSNFAFAQSKAQAYIGHIYPNHIFWRVGQFDSLLGYEPNATKDLFFSNQGQVWTEVPIVHTGLTVGYKIRENLSVQGIVANHHDQGKKADGNGPDGGAKATYTFNNWAFNGGFLVMDRDTSEEWMAEANAEYKMNKFTFATDVLVKKMTAQNTAGFGMLGSVLYQINTILSAGVRIDGIQKMSNYKRFQPSLALNARMSDELVAKLTYSNLESQAVENSVTDRYSYTTLNAVYAF